MEDPFSQVGGPPPEEVWNDPFHPFAQRSTERLKAHRIRLGLIVAAVVVVGLAACNVVSSFDRGLGNDPAPVVVQSGAMIADEVSARTSALPEPTSSVGTDSVLPEGEPTGDVFALALLVGLEVTEGKGRQGEVPIGAFAANGFAGPCSTRDVVLQQEALSGEVVGCSVDGGSWISRYEGQETSEESNLAVDHVVSEISAWEAGAWAWDQATRAAFMNDTDFPESLTAVSQWIVRDKDGRGIVEWLPPNQAFHCEYAAAWVRVKYRWQLSVSNSESAALRSILAECPPQDAPDPTRIEVVFNSEESSDVVGDSAVVGDVAGEEAESAVDGLDPRFRTCGDANSMGYGPYVAGIDPEYDWYQDRDSDGRVCEM